MDRETLMEAISKGPVTVVMNTGDRFEIPSRDFAIVDEIAAHVLMRDADGKYRAKILSLVTMSIIENHTSSENS